MNLSVILPCFNGEATLAVQLDALTRQQWQDSWEVVVVNNGSTDRSMEIVSAYLGQLPGLRIVQAHEPGTTRLGVPHSYNCGIAAATGDAFVFCEADDEVAPGWLQAMGQALRQHPFVAARLDHRKLNPTWLQPQTGEGYQSTGLWRPGAEPRYEHASGCGFGLRRDLVERLGPFDTTLACGYDMEYCWRAQRAGLAMHFEPNALVHYREKQTPRARMRQARGWAVDNLEVVRRYGGSPGRLPLLRQLLAVGLQLPRTGWNLLISRLRWPGAQYSAAQQVWQLGWELGRLKALWRRASSQPLPLTQHKAGLPQ